MNINRREFLSGAGSLALTALASCNDEKGKSQQVHQKEMDQDDLLDLRDEFDLSDEYIHLSLFYLASHPRPVRRAIDKYRREIDRNPLLTVERGVFSSGSSNLLRQVKEAAGDYLDTSPDHIAITFNTTSGLALVYNGLRIKTGQEILTTEHDHFSQHESIRLAAEKSGATMKKISLFDDFDSITEDSIVERIQNAIGSQTRAVGVTWVHSSSGVKLPLAGIAEMIADVNKDRDEEDRILFIVDGVHGLGVEEDSFESLGCDFLIAGTHKWVLGPRGTGIICGRDWAWSQLRPTIPTFDAGEIYTAWLDDRQPRGDTRASWVSPGGFHAYEYQWAVADAFRFLLSIGKTKIAKHIYALNSYCKSELASMKKIKLYTPMKPNLSSGMIALDIDGMSADHAVNRLLERKIVASVSPYQHEFIRLAPSLANTADEMERVIEEIRSL